MPGSRGVEFLKQITKIATSSTGFEQFFKNIVITGGGNGRCIAEFVVKSENLNGGGTLHGGFTATVVDNYTTYALMTLDKPPGVSVDLHVSYLKGAKEGETIVIDAKTIKAGRTLAYLECELRNKKDDSILARGLQTKFIGH